MTCLYTKTAIHTTPPLTPPPPSTTNPTITEKRKREENNGSNPLIERQNQLDKKEVMRLTMMVEGASTSMKTSIPHNTFNHMKTSYHNTSNYNMPFGNISSHRIPYVISPISSSFQEMKASSTVQGTVNPLLEKQRDADRREIVRLNGVIEEQKKASGADGEEIVRLTRLLEATKQAAVAAASSSSSTDATARAAVFGEENGLPGNGRSENESGTTMALLLAERQATADKREIERLSMMLDETLVLLNETNQERAAAEEHIIELRGKVDSVRDVVINEATVRATEAQLMVVNRQLKEVSNPINSILPYKLCNPK